MNATRKNILNRNLEEVLERIDRACARSGRDKSEVRLIAVSKYVDSATVREMVELGLSDFGENRIQVAEPKLNDLADLPIRWHWIGNLQTNKVRKVVGRFHEFHSLDRIALIEALVDRLENPPSSSPELPRLPVYLQVNVSGEETKSGFSPDEALMAGQRLLESRSLLWVGLMTLAPHTEDAAATRPVFAKLRETRDFLADRLGASLPRLSMGMSNDFEVAIEEGATDVRIGSILYRNL